MRAFIILVLGYHLLSAITGIYYAQHIEQFKESITTGLMMFQFIVDVGIAAFAVVMLSKTPKKAIEAN